jgi:WD40 repeat protein
MMKLPAAGLAAFLAVSAVGDAQDKPDAPIAYVVPKRDKPVDFRAEILPILKSQCIACHHAKEPEGGLVLETPKQMLAGGDNGPAIVPGKGAESFLVQVAALKKKPHMPPKKNKLDAKRLTPEQLGLLQLWIDQGAKESGGPVTLEPPKWQPVSAAWNPIYAVALDAQGQRAAAGRAGRLHVYHVPSGRLEDQPVDPRLAPLAAPGTPGLVDRDAIYALAFSPDGSRLATGGYRALKMWKREAPATEAKIELPADAKLAELSPDGKLLAVAGTEPLVRILELSGGKPARELKGHAGPVHALRFSPDGAWLLTGSADKTLRVWKSADGSAAGRVETPAPVTAVEWAAQGRQLVSAGADGPLRVWALPDAASLAGDAPKAAPLKEHKAKDLTILAAAPGGVLAGSADGKFALWNLETGAKSKDAAHGAALAALAASPDGKRWISVGGPAAGLWNAENAQKIADLRTDGPARAEDLVAAQDVVLAALEVAYRQQNVKTLEENKKKEEEEVKKATDALPISEKALKEKEEALAKAKTEREAAEKVFDEAKAKALTAPPAEEAAKLDAASKGAAEAATQAAAAAKEAAKALDAAQKAAAGARKPAEAAAAATAAAEKSATEAEGAVKAAGEDAAKKAAAEEAKRKADAALARAKAEQDAARKALGAAEQAAEAAAKADADARARAEQAAQAAAKAKEALAALKQAQEAAKAAEAKLKDAMTKKENAVKAESGARSALDGAKLNVESSKGRIDKAKEAVERDAKAIAEANRKLEAGKEAQKQSEAKRKERGEAIAKARLPIRSAAFVLGGAAVALGDEAGRVHLFGSEKGLDGGTAEAHQAPVLALGGPGTDRTSVAADGTVRLAGLSPRWTLAWSVEPAEPEKAPVDRVLALSFSPDGKTLASGGGVPSRDGEVALWNAGDGRLQRTIAPAHSDTVFDVAFSPDGKLLATCAADRFMKVFDLETGRLAKSFEGHTHHVLGVSWNRTGRALATAGADEAVKVWNYETGQQVKTIPGFAKQATAIRYPGADAVFLVASGGTPLRQVNEGGNVMRNYDVGGAFVYDLAVSADGQTVAAGGLDGTLRVWRVSDGAVLGAYAPPK